MFGHCPLSWQNKPMAVGGLGMICTANYKAREYGVRSAMPGFIARELCKALVFVAPNFSKYQAVAEATREIFREYDPHFTAGSLDEAYLDLTACVQKRGADAGDRRAYWALAEEVVDEMRGRVREKCRLTCSAGKALVDRLREGKRSAVVWSLRPEAACSALSPPAGIANAFCLAKIAADVNKPNGQHLVSDIGAFLRDLPVRKICGVGKVLERLLTEGLGIQTCQHLLEKRALLLHCFTPQNAAWLMMT